MEFYTFLSKEGVIKFFTILIFWGIRWFYGHQKDSDYATSHKKKDNNEDDYNKEHKEDDYDEKDAKQEINHQPCSTMGRPVAPRKAQMAPLPQEVAPHPRSSTPTSRVDRKAHLIGKRKLFRSALLMHELMKRKNHII
ncbi:hypothetical protein [Cardinium endosymbiont of Bemisia tabaci]|uniref:hypothetical protein n=1 Tax=Cardinium endosymbiont of Bemisia tabaci TaxID=672794 RepID=UPI000442D0DC|nr:hypothetical protein [Cardinium endosymbiont of Bemisia tabaci]CDG49705.1 Hypothetical protein CHV_a0392 [Cardinium endosymbiont cBtQ1 of Bemisia tabaci]